MKRIAQYFSLAVTLLSLTAFSQAQTTTITASHLKISGYPISNGEVLITPVNVYGAAIPFADGTGAQNGPQSFACQIVAGAITGAISETGTVSGTCSVPDATETTPSNILYSFQVIDQSTGLKTSGDAYTIQGVVGVSGATWALDHYGPPSSTTNVAAVQAAQGTSVPTSCTAPSVFTLLNGSGSFVGFYTCVGGTEVAVSGGSSAVASVFGRTGAITAQTGDYTVAQITGAAPLASPTFTGTPVVPGYETSALAALLAPIASPTFTGVVTAPSFVGPLTGNASTATNLTGTPALPNGTTGTTQSVGDNSNKLATDAFVLANAATGGATSFLGLTGTAAPSQLPAATSTSQGAVELPTGQSSNILGSAAFTSSTAYDAFGAAASAITTAEGYSSNASNLTSGTVNASRLPSGLVTSTPTLGDLLSSTGVSGVVSVRHRVVATIGEGDSYVVGYGVANGARDGYFGRFVRDTATNYWANYAITGTTTSQIALQTFASVYYDPNLPIAYVNDGGINDANQDACSTASTTTNCVKNAQLSVEAYVAWESIPPAYRIFASAATLAGTWGTDTTVGLAANPTGVNFGTAEHATSSGATATFSVPSSTSGKVGVTYAAINGGTGTFTIKVDGTLQTDFCSGTTTFTDAGCGAQAMVSNSPFRQEFAVTPGTSHTVIITTLSATSVPVISVDWIPPSTVSNVNPVYFVGGPTTTGTIAPTVIPYYNTAIASIINQLNADGLPTFFVDLVNGNGGIANVPADYSTTATTGCVATTATGHPNVCGAEAIEQTILNEEVVGGYQVSSYNDGASAVAASGKIDSVLGINYGNPSTSSAWASVSDEMNLGNYPTPTMTFYDAGSNRFGIYGFDIDNSSGTPWAGSYGTLCSGAAGYASCLFAGYNNGSAVPSSFNTVGFVQFSTGNTSFKGTDSRLNGSLAAAATIAPTTEVTTLSGSTSIATITAPSNFSSTYGGPLYFVVPSGVTSTFTTGGNIANPTTVGSSGVVTGPAVVIGVYAGLTWYLK